MQETTDLLNESNSSQDKLWTEYPEQMAAFVGLSNAIKAPGSLDVKYKYLIALALGITAHCDWCIAAHTRNALAAGATREEILEASWMAVLMGGGPALMFMQVVQKALEDLSPQGEAVSRQAA